MTQFDYGKQKYDGQFERYPVNLDGEKIRPYRDTYVHDKCGVATKMGSKLAETYQKNPQFYSHTFCVGCGNHFPVSQFKWDDGEIVGS